MSKTKNIYMVAIYLRLSRDDGDKAESDSIQNQRTLIKDYIQNDSSLYFVDEYVDDGYTGTNFDRPGFIKMMDDVQNKKIDCIIVKDLSRLGRNYIDTGRYIEKIFPMMGVRFISITDHYDSGNEKDSESNSIIIPFKNLLNDAYCRDISMKVRSQLDVRRKKGEHVGSFAIYGYVKDPDEKGKIIPDEPAAAIVRRMFNMCLEGYTVMSLAEKLNQEGVLSPFEYKNRAEKNYFVGFKPVDGGKWSDGIVRRILTDERYLGIMIQGKRKKINYRLKKIINVPKEEWIRVENTHEPLVSKEVFDLVQKLLKSKSYRSNKECLTLKPLSGMIKCADCGATMIVRYCSKTCANYKYFQCRIYNEHKGCKTHRISQDKVYKAVSEAVKKELQVLVDTQKIINEIEMLPLKNYNIQELDKQIDDLEKSINYYKDLTIRLYKDLHSGVVTKEEYDLMYSNFSQKIKEAKQSEERLFEKREKLLTSEYDLSPWIKTFKQIKNFDELQRKEVVQIIDKVLVYDKNRIEVIFYCQDELNVVLEYLERMKAEKKGEEKCVVSAIPE